MEDFTLINLDQVVKITAKDSKPSECYYYVKEDKKKFFGLITVEKKGVYFNDFITEYVFEDPNELINYHLENDIIYHDPRIIITFSDGSTEVIYCKDKADMDVKFNRLKSQCKNLSGELNG